MMQIENTYFRLADGHKDRNVIVICDRGAMDASACETRTSIPIISIFE